MDARSSLAYDPRMPTFKREELELNYEVHGAGYPVLLFAPGGMRSSIAFWQKTPYDPIRELSPHFRVIAMDQRNAGASRGPVAASDGWHTYAADQLALLNELGVERCHLLGNCIGGAFALELIRVAPERVSAAVLQQPIGDSGTNRQLFHTMFDGWAEELVKSRPEIAAPALAGLKANLYGGSFTFSVTGEDVMRCRQPLLVLRGDDQYHPAAVSEEIARIAPRAELIEKWKTGDDVTSAVSRVVAFLKENTPR
ncbi:MAG TPA: alpha/beta hydrolase [Polyangiaceae bacterium]|jgi:pimeloyl-ACP methyl ester carboxylesterase|nr:alpha/beta hydrolase [Polyangiaceae bacterium]